MSLKIHYRIDRYNQPVVDNSINIKTQMLRLDKENNVVATLSHKEIIKLRDTLSDVIKKHQLNGKSNQKPLTRGDAN